MNINKSDWMRLKMNLPEFEDICNEAIDFQVTLDRISTSLDVRIGTLAMFSYMDLARLKQGLESLMAHTFSMVRSVEDIPEKDLREFTEHFPTVLSVIRSKENNNFMNNIRDPRYLALYISDFYSFMGLLYTTLLETHKENNKSSISNFAHIFMKKRVVYKLKIDEEKEK